MYNLMRLLLVEWQLLPFVCLNFNYSALSHNLVSNGRNFVKLILSIYDHNVILHMDFCQDVLSNRGVIVLD